jgi:hypothetical protein
MPAFRDGDRPPTARPAALLRAACEKCAGHRSSLGAAIAIKNQKKIGDGRRKGRAGPAGFAPFHVDGRRTASALGRRHPARRFVIVRSTGWGVRGNGRQRIFRDGAAGSDRRRPAATAAGRRRRQRPPPAESRLLCRVACQTQAPGRRPRGPEGRRKRRRPRGRSAGSRAVCARVTWYCAIRGPAARAAAGGHGLARIMILPLTVAQPDAPGPGHSPTRMSRSPWQLDCGSAFQVQVAAPCWPTASPGTAEAGRLARPLRPLRASPRTPTRSPHQKGRAKAGGHLPTDHTPTSIRAASVHWSGHSQQRGTSASAHQLAAGVLN